MKLHDNDLRYRNPGTTQDLVLRIVFGCAVPHEEALENARVNSLKDVPWLEEAPEHDGVALVVGKGPSLADTLSEIRIEQKNGATVFACNSSAIFLHKNGINPEYQCFLDPHHTSLDEFFDADCHLLASIVDPRLFDMAKKPVLWHPAFDKIETVIPDREFLYIGGGVTVTNSVVCICYTMGFRDVRVHGIDSSFRDGKTYAFDEVSSGLKVSVEHNGKSYDTAYDMKEQVVVFMKLAKMLKALGCRVQVFGSGLLPDVFKEVQCQQ